MKAKTLTQVILIAAFAALALPVRPAAQEERDHGQHRRYRLVDIGAFGGPNSFVGAVITVDGDKLIGLGAAETPDLLLPNTNPYNCFDPNLMNAFTWENDRRTNLHSLNSDENCSLAGGVDGSSVFFGNSENGAVDPLTGIKQLRAVRWKHGEIHSLGTLGGNHSAALGMNKREQIIGWALNKFADPFSLFDLTIRGSSNGTQSRAFVWQPGNRMRGLGTLGGPDAQAFFINDRGQIAGFSYVTSTPNSTTGLPTLHPFLWHKGKMKDLGTLGGFGVR